MSTRWGSSAAILTLALAAAGCSPNAAPRAPAPAGEAREDRPSASAPTKLPTYDAAREKPAAAERDALRARIASEERKYLQALANGNAAKGRQPGLATQLDPEAGLSATPPAFSPDGKYLANAGRDHAVVVWELATGKQYRRFGGHTGSVTALCFTPSGKALASASRDKTIRVWDLGQNKEAKQAKLQNEVLSLDVSPDGRSLACCDSQSYTPKVRVYDLGTSAERYVLSPGPVAGVYSVRFSRTGLLAAHSDKAVHLWDAATGRPIDPPDVGGNPSGVVFSPDGWVLAIPCFASPGNQGKLILWDLAANQVRTVTDVKGVVTCSGFSPDGRTLLCEEEDRATLRDPKTGELRESIPPLRAGAFAFSPGGEILAGSHELGLYASGDLGRRPPAAPAPAAPPPPGKATAARRPVETREALGAFLAGTEWAWGGGGLRLDPGGSAVQSEWAAAGLVTRWEAIDRRTAVLVVVKGREHDRYAVLQFAEDLGSFTGYDFEGGRRLEPTRRKVTKPAPPATVTLTPDRKDYVVAVNTIALSAYLDAVKAGNVDAAQLLLRQKNVVRIDAPVQVVKDEDWGEWSLVTIAEGSHKGLKFVVRTKDLK